MFYKKICLIYFIYLLLHTNTIKSKINWSVVVTSSLTAIGTTIGIRIFEQLYQKFDINKKSVSIKNKQISFSDIGGYEKLKEDLMEIIEEATDPLNTNTNATCILLYGPPGTGKTYFAQALAYESKLSIKILDSTDIEASAYYGESEKATKKILETAQSQTPTILFFDEIDNLLSHRGQGGGFKHVLDNIKNLFITYMDGTHNMKGVIIIGATNNISNMDPAFLRSGRFEHKFLLDYPNKEDRTKIITLYLKKHSIELSKEITIESIVEQTNGLSPADINSLFKNIIQIIKKNNKRNPDTTTPKRILTEKIFSTALNVVKSSLATTPNKVLPQLELSETLKKIFNSEALKTIFNLIT